MPPVTSQAKGWEVIPTPLKAYTPEWFLFNYLEAFNDEDMEIAIRKDIRPDLSNYTDVILNQTTEFFVKLFKVHRPDLAQRIESRDGRAWLKKIVKSAMFIKK